MVSDFRANALGPGDGPRRAPVPPTRRPSPPRRWRRRGRRAQVAPVATILGLLLVVTFIATYLTTTLPSQMAVNDLNHEILVEDQLAHLATTAVQLAAARAVGGQATFPISLGSASTPPFAGPDSAQIVPLTNYTGGTYAFFVSYSITASSGTQALGASSQPGSGFVVALRNTYSSSAEVAYDEGAVVYAEPGGVPLMEDPPAISLSNGALSILMPVFVNGVGAEAGTSTAELSLRLASLQSIAVPVNGFALANGVPVVITIYTPYAAAWLNYYSGLPAFSGATIGCTPTPTGSNSVCSPSFLYEPGHGIGEVTISIPATSLSITQAFFAVHLA